MSTPQANTPEGEGFIPGQSYTFDPPVVAACISVAGKATLTRKPFVEGWCLGHNRKGPGYVFQGKPKGESIDHFFIAEWGKGSLAECIPASQPQPAK